MGERLPIIYLRGYAGGPSGIDKQVDDPFYGFNDGSTHVRVGEKGAPRFYQFESPLLRLMLDEGYQVRVEGSQQALLTTATDDSIDANTIWIYRFYDTAASTFDWQAANFDLEQAAQGLLGFVRLVLQKTKNADRVYLVAHSMGGLVCRSMLQKYCEDPAGLVAKLFTYGTPHGGIEFDRGGGVLEWVMNTFGPNGADIFGPKRMYQYLTRDASEDGPPRDWHPRSIAGSGFPVERVFCLVGTDPGDYAAALGLSAGVVGAKSDGLVQIRNGYVRGANRAYVHRSHSGRYGLVNSEEGYQNLRRFLFGALKVEVGLTSLHLVSDEGTIWQAKVRLSVRGLPVVMHEQLAAHWCPVQLAEEAAKLDTPDSPIPLVTTFLLRSTHESRTCRYALQMRVLSLKEHRGIFQFHDHLEQMADWGDILVVDVEADQERIKTPAGSGTPPLPAPLRTPNSPRRCRSRRSVRDCAALYPFPRSPDSPCSARTPRSASRSPSGTDMGSRAA
jgi:pimeloyl-ACP methyl ester carboxylesterase